MQRRRLPTIIFSSTSCRKISRKVRENPARLFVSTDMPRAPQTDEVLEEAQLKALVELVVEFTLIPEQPGYIVDAMFAHAPALKV